MFQLLDRLTNWYANLRYDQDMKKIKKTPEYEEMKLEDVKLDQSGLSVTISHSSVANIANEFAQLLVDTNCDNYLQFVLYAKVKRGIRPVEVTLRWYDGGKTPSQKAAELEAELNAAKAFHPRAMKLIGKKKPFIVIANDEPYFIRAYMMIRDHETNKGTWTIGDEALFQEQYGAFVEAHGRAFPYD